MPVKFLSSRDVPSSEKNMQFVLCIQLLFLYLCVEKIKLVVLNECVLGYIHPDLKGYVQVLHASILKGSPYGLYPYSIYIGSTDNIRLASEIDFEDYRCVFSDSYRTDEYEYKIN
jgi:hypothetical protein